MKYKNLLLSLDLGGQLLMLLPLALYANGRQSEHVLLCYCTVGGWQLISLCANWYGAPASRQRRAGYARALRGLIWITLTIVPLATLGIFTGNASLALPAIAEISVVVILVYLYALLLTGPVLAVWYFCIGVRELRDSHAAAVHRREIHWKL